MFLLFIFVLLAVTFLLLKSFSVKQPFTITLIFSFVLSLISTISLWSNYKEIFGEQDGIAISNQISYWIITDGIYWSHSLFFDYFIYSLLVSILIILIIIISFFIKKPGNIE